MGKYIYVDDENNTSVQDLKKIHGKLITACLKTKIDVNINFHSREKELNSPVVYITFFVNDENFSVTLYSFWKLEKNKNISDLAMKLMKDDTRYEEIKQKFKDERFD